MVNIFLCCEYGASTSLVAAKIAEAAKNRNIDAFVEAYSINSISDIIGKADVILLGPQVRFMARKIMREYGDAGVPIISMDPSAYGRCDGESILTTALDAIEKK